MSLPFAFIGDFGNVLIMILSLVAAIIVGLYVLAYAAHALLTVVEGTAAGNDVVKWPDEPVADGLARSFFLLGLVMLWAGPAAILSSALSRDWLEDDGGRRFLLLAVPGLWLLFPVGLLSSLSASSRWIVFRSSIVFVLLRLFPATFIFYVLTAILAIGSAVAWYYAICRQAFAMLLVAGPLGAACFLIYARLIGRLSERIQRLNPTKAERDEKPKKKKKRRRPDESQPLPSASEPGNGWDPMEETANEPEEEEPELLEEVESEEAAPEPVVEKSLEDDNEFPLQPLERDEAYDNRWKEPFDDGPAVPYDMSGEPAAKTPEYQQLEEYDIDDMGPQLPAEKRTGEGILKHLDKPRERPRRRRQRPVPVPPKPSWWQGVFNFPFYATSIGAWVWLTLGFSVFGLLCGLVVANFPKGE